jgi:opacity protein-like surface antigen
MSKRNKLILIALLYILVFNLVAIPALANDQSHNNNSFKNANLYNPNKNQKFEFGIVKTNTDYSSKMFDRQEFVTDKSLQILKSKKSGLIDDNSMYVGGRVIASYVWENTNTDGKFPILSRIPNQHTANSVGTEELLNDASINITINYENFTIFAQGEYTDVEYSGQEQAQMRKYYVMYGDLEKHPFYAAFGRKTVSFGNFTSYAPITHNHSSHYFWSQTDKPLFEVGYYKDKLNIVATLMANDRGLRVVNAPDNSGYENFALNITKEFETSENSNLLLGAGYLKGTIYDSTLAHHPPIAGFNDRSWNGAWNLHAIFSWNKWDFGAEFSRTIDDWPATDWEVSALTLQTRYKTDFYEKPTIFSLMFSRGEQGDNGTEWEQMLQTVVGAEVKLTPNLELGAEYLFNRGFVPLILPTITGDRDVESHTVLFAAQLTF